MQNIGEKIKKLRELRNFTQDYMATQLEMTQAGYSKVEGGQTDIAYSKIVEIAKVLDVSPEELIAFDSQKIFSSFNNITDSTNIGIITTLSEEIKNLYEDKVALLNKLLKNTESELQRYKDKFGEV